MSPRRSRRRELHGRGELDDLTTDPEEPHNLAGTQPERVQQLITRFASLPPVPTHDERGRKTKGQ